MQTNLQWNLKNNFCSFSWWLLTFKIIRAGYYKIYEDYVVIKLIWHRQVTVMSEVLKFGLVCLMSYQKIIPIPKKKNTGL